MLNTTNLENIKTTQPPLNTWQCVFICWGNKYTTELINNLVNKIHCYLKDNDNININNINDNTKNNSIYHKETVQYVLLTDSLKPTLSTMITQVLIPDYFNQKQFKTSGCHAKLCMFEQGVLPLDVPTVYIDLDTVICGDISQALIFLTTPKTVTIFQSAILPFSAFSRGLYKISNKKYYARGNSSIIVFQPSQCHYIASEFKVYNERYPHFGIKPLRADERFISWIAQNNMQAIPKSFAVKFPTEFMFPYRIGLYIKAYLPWIKKRRQGLIAITLNGLDIKPEKLLSLNEGDMITDEKQRYLIWSNCLMGISKEKIIAFYSDV